MPMPAADPAIALADVHLTLPSDAGAVAILRGVDLLVMPGETVALTGASGSGKSSIVMVMTGLEQATAGKVAIGGTDVTHATEDELAAIRATHIGIVFQSFHLVPGLTALENVALPLEFLGRPAARAAAGEMLRLVGLEARGAHYPTQLSGGEQQRVAIARALAPRPSVIVADEPTGNLDHATGQRIADLLFESAERFGATLVLITHDRELAARCRRVLRVEDGRVVAAPQAKPAQPRMQQAAS